MTTKCECGKGVTCTICFLTAACEEYGKPNFCTECRKDNRIIVGDTRLCITCYISRNTKSDKVKGKSVCKCFVCDQIIGKGEILCAKCTEK